MADQSRVTLLCRCNEINDSFHDLYVVPSVRTDGVVRIKGKDIWLNRGKRITNLSQLRLLVDLMQRGMVSK